MSNFDNMIIFAARYAHNRPTGAALAVVNYAKENWDKLSDQTKNFLVEESEMMATCNLEDWRELKKLLDADTQVSATPHS